MKEEYEKYWEMPRKIKSGLELDICPSYSWGNVLMQTVGISILVFAGASIIIALLKETGSSIQIEDSFLAVVIFIAFLIAIRFKSIVLEFMFQLGICPLGGALLLSGLALAYFPDYAPLLCVIVWPILFLFRVYSLIRSLKEYNEVAEYYQSDLLPKKEILSLFKKGQSLSDICALGRERVEENIQDAETNENECKDNADESFSDSDIPDFEPEENQEPETAPKMDMPEFEPEADPEPEPDSEIKFSRDFDFKDSKNL